MLRVWVTRDEEPDGPFCLALHAAGLSAVLEPVLARQVVDDCAASVANLGPNDWLVLTSPFAVRSVAAPMPPGPRVAVVGESSRRAALECGLRVELVSRGGDAASLFEELASRMTVGKVCYPRSSLVEARPGWAGVELSCPILYQTVRRDFDRRIVERIDVVGVASPSAVQAVGRVDRPYASIGPTTSKALRGIGVTPTIEAPDRTFASLAAAILDYTKRSRHHLA